MKIPPSRLQAYGQNWPFQLAMRRCLTHSGAYDYQNILKKPAVIHKISTAVISTVEPFMPFVHYVKHRVQEEIDTKARQNTNVHHSKSILRRNEEELCFTRYSLSIASQHRNLCSAPSISANAEPGDTAISVDPRHRQPLNYIPTMVLSEASNALRL